MSRGAQISVITLGPDSKNFEDNSLNLVIQGQLEEFAAEVEEELAKDIDEAARIGVDAIRNLSPYHRGSGRGHYRTGWTYDLKRDGLGYVGAVIYNRNKPTLAHLLEYGHNIVRGGKLGKGGKVYGFVAAREHIETGKQAAFQYLASKGWAA